MKKLTIALGCLIGVLVSPSLTIAGDVGNRWGAFSPVGVGARALGMGGAFVAVADDATSIYWNPAGLAFIDGRSVTAMYAKLHGLSAKNGLVAYAQPDSGLGAAGIGWTNISVTGLETANQEQLAWSESAITYAYAKKATSFASVGIAANWLLVRSDIEDGNANGLSLDAAAMFHFLDTFRLGLSLKNLHARVKWDTETKDRLPLLIDSGVSFKPNSQLVIGLSLTAGKEPFLRRLAVGGEYWVIKDVFALREGLVRIINGNERFIFCGGIGLRYHYGQIDYAYVLDGKALGNTHRFSVSLWF